MEPGNVTIHWKAVEQYFIVVLLGFQFYPVCNFEKFVNFGLKGGKGRHVLWSGSLMVGS